MSCKLSSLKTGIRKVIPQAGSPVRAAGYKARGDRNFYVLIDALDVNERNQRSLKSLFALKRMTRQQLR